MKAAVLLAELRAAGVQPSLRGDGIAVPAGRLTDEQREAIKRHKPELVELLRNEAANDSELSHSADSEFSEAFTRARCAARNGRAGREGYGKGGGYSVSGRNRAGADRRR